MLILDLEFSPAAKPHTFLNREQITEEFVTQAYRLNEIAQGRGQTLAQMALAWVVRHDVSTSAQIGASTVKQIEDCAATANHLDFTADELQTIDAVLQPA